MRSEVDVGGLPPYGGERFRVMKPKRVNADKPHLWKADIAASVDQFNQQDNTHVHLFITGERLGLMMTRLLMCCLLLVVTTPLVAETTNAIIEIKLGVDQTLVFRRISPQSYQIDYPDFYVLETEVTNAQYQAYLDATSRTKDDTDVLQIIKERGLPTTGDIPYSIEDASTIWRDGVFPSGLEDHPVALVTLPDVVAFADWVGETHHNNGLVRLPTWNEWMIAAYGKSRHYPWGDEWKPSSAHTSHGITNEFEARMRKEPDKRPVRTEPVKSRPNGRSPEGLYGLIGNVSEYIITDDPSNSAYFRMRSRFMGGGFTDGRSFSRDENSILAPRTDCWGYFHFDTARLDHLGFRLVIDPSKNDALRKRPRLFEQNNRGWMVDESKQK